MSVNERLAEVERKLNAIDLDASSVPKRKSSEPIRQEHMTPSLSHGVSLLCKNFSEFVDQACGAETVAFHTRGVNEFCVSAIKNSVTYRFNGETPAMSVLVKAWLQGKLDVKEERIVEERL